MIDPLSKAKECDAEPSKRFARLLSCFTVSVGENAIQNEVAWSSAWWPLHSSSLTRGTQLVETAFYALLA